MMSQRAGKMPCFLFLVANLLMPLSLLIFATGFFPYKTFLAGTATFNGIEGDHAKVAPFDKVILMVVDALRSDFVYSPNSGFTFTQKLIRSGAALPFTAYAGSPTITMPRIKAITTGSVPSFLDVILNFAESDTSSSLAHQDNWLTQLKAKEGGNIVMYGDDTWLKLFPDTFLRADGTSSFFVSDFTEVDNNVTRHIRKELEQDDWNGMILHYLGLDHIGHKSGPRSIHMIPKQSEMDGIVKLIYEAIETRAHFRSTLLILCGDHGMNDGGNHGGSSDGETSPALVFISPRFQAMTNGSDSPLLISEGQFNYYHSVEQSDIAPTLAGLLGFPVPLNNLGVLIPNFLPLWSEREQVELMMQNARQIQKLVNETFPSNSFESRASLADCMDADSDGEALNCMWVNIMKTVNSREHYSSESFLDLLITYLNQARYVMSNAASKYDVWKLYSGAGIAFLAMISILGTCAAQAAGSISTNSWITSVALIYGAMMFASSYVEEEHHFWYWVTSGMFGWLFFKDRNLGRKDKFWAGISIPLLLLIMRVIRAWNQTGQKHAGEPDIARHVFSANTHMLWLLVFATYLNLAIRLSWSSLPPVPTKVISAMSLTLCIAALRFKVSFTSVDSPELLSGLPRFLWSFIDDSNLVSQARVVFSAIGAVLTIAAFTRAYERPSSETHRGGFSFIFHNLFTIFLMTQSRVTNIFLFLLLEILFSLLSSLSLSAAEITLLSFLLQYSSFFAFGGSNAISSIDLSNAYNGVDEYSITVVGILTFCGNWAGPIWCMSATNLLLLEQRSQGHPQPLFRHLSVLTALNITNNLAVMLACTLLRTHLFIWTVFSPKYLYSLAWSVGQHIGVNLVLGSLLFWIGCW